MSSSKNLRFSRRAALSALVGVLAGCGFAPVYGPGGRGEGLQGVILADAPDNRNAFVFVNQFEERLGRADAPQYRLQYLLGTRIADVGITPAAETTRKNLFGGVSYTLRDSGTNRIITEGFIETFVGFSTTRLIVSTRAVERDAEERLMRILADRVANELIATAPDWRT